MSLRLFTHSTKWWQPVSDSLNDAWGRVPEPSRGSRSIHAIRGHAVGHDIKGFDRYELIWTGVLQ